MGQDHWSGYWYLCLLLYLFLVRANSDHGLVRGDGSPPPLGQWRAPAEVTARFPPRGGFDREISGSDEEEDSAYPTEDYRGPLPPSISRKKNRRRKSTLQSLAEKSVKLTTKTALATAKQSGKAAYYLVKPKHVEKAELIGLWRMDQQILPSNRNAIPMECCANIELTLQSVLVTVYDENSSDEKETRTRETPWKFTPAQWPRAAKVEFAARAFLVEGQRQQLFFYKGQVDRKLAARSVIKIRGKIYRIEKAGWRGKNYKHVPVGTFVARRRLKLEEEFAWDEDQEDEGTDYESDENSEDGFDGGSEAGEDEQTGRYDGRDGETYSKTTF